MKLNVESREARRTEHLSGLRELVLEPRPPGPRRVGPGRVERRYQERIAGLQRSLERDGERQRDLERRLDRAQGELATAGRVERGLQRLADRLEERAETAVQREKRLILALGSLHKENELLRARLGLRAGEPAPALTAADMARPPSVRRGPRSARRPGLLARLFGRRPPA